MLKRKSFTALTAVAVLILAVIASFFGIKNVAPAMAAESAGIEKVSQGFEYRDEDTKKIISGFTLPATVKGDYQVIIPDGVTEIGDYAFSQESLLSVTIPKSVKKIGEHAFNGCAKLAGIEFEGGRSESLSISSHAFRNCPSLSVFNLPDKTTVGQYAFYGCTSLLWVYVGNDCLFKSSSGGEDSAAVFFPADTSITIIFPSKAEYNKMLGWQDSGMTESIFKQKHLSAATYIVNVNCYVGASTEPVVYERMHGKSFNYVPDKNSGEWNTDTAYDVLPAQDAAYSSTVWYSEEALNTVIDYEWVNGRLETESEVNLYCHATISVPVFPAEPVSWVYKKDVSYDINNVAEVLKALGCEQEFTEAQLNALDFSVSFADEKGNPADTPEAINVNGVYSVKLSLKPEFGSWAQEVTSSITVNVDTNPFTIVMIVLLVIGVLAGVITVSTAVIRKKVQQRNKKKQLSQKEVIEKFKAAGGKTDLE